MHGQAPVAFAGQDSATIAIVATDTAGNQKPLSYNVYFDNTAPVITLDGSAPALPPAVNTTAQSPFVFSGTVTEANPAGATINNQAVALTPVNDAYTFSAGLLLPRGGELNRVASSLFIILSK